MIKKLLTLSVFLWALLPLFSQDNSSLQGDWQLKIVDLKDNGHTELKKEESFFAHYLDVNNKLHISENYIPIVLGGEQYTYEYDVTDKHIVLKYMNTIMIQTENKEVITKNMEGNTRLNYKFTDNNTLVISLRNETFTETYTFIRIN